MNSEGKKVLFIVNKFAGTGYQPAVEGRMIDASVANDAECTLEYTAGPGHAIELAAQAAAQGFDFVVAVGGDGTINEVARGAHQANIPMGIIPRGSGNGLSRHLGIPLSIGDAAHALFKSRVVAMDVFTVNGKLSLNVSGIGFDGHIANLFGGKSKRGLAGYTKLTIQEFMAAREFEATITAGGETHTRKAFIIAIANASQYGNNARVAPRASICDERLYINIMRKVPAYRLDFVYNMFIGDIAKSPFCDIREATRMEVHTSQPVAYHVDGEPCGHDTHFQIELIPHALQILVPATSTNV